MPWHDDVTDRVAVAVQTMADEDVAAVLQLIAEGAAGSFEDSVFAIEACGQLASTAQEQQDYELVDELCAATAHVVARSTARLDAENLLIGSVRHFRRVVGPYAALGLADGLDDLLETCLQPDRVGFQSAALANLRGEIFRELGELETAQQHYEWALETLLNDPVANDDLHSSIRSNLALALQARGDLDGARGQLRRSLALCADHQSLGYAYSLDNLGSVEFDLGVRYGQSYGADNLRAGETMRLALDHLRAAEDIFRTTLPETADDLVISLEHAAQVTRSLGDDEAWREVADELTRLIQSVPLSGDSFWRAAVVNAELAVTDGHPEAAIEVLISAWNRIESTGSREHLHGLSTLAGLLHEQGYAEQLDAVEQIIVTIEDEALERLLGSGSERETAVAFATYRHRLQQFLGRSLPEQDGPVDPHVYEVVLNRKGLLAERRGRLWLASHDRPEVAERVVEVRSLRAQVARLDVDGADAHSVQAARREHDRVSHLLDRAEAQLAQELASDGHPSFVRREFWELQRVLGPDELFVDLVRLRDSRGTVHYAAFAYSHRDGLNVVRLGSADAVDAALAEFVQASPKATAALAAALPAVSALFAGGPRRVIIAPTGVWCGVPVCLLPGHDDVPMIESCVVSTVPSARWLIARRNESTQSPSTAPAVVLGDPDFDLDDALEDLDFTMRWRVDRLRHSRHEAERVGQLLGVTPALDRDASRALLLAVRRPRILHVASHGTYLDARHGLRELSEPVSYTMRVLDEMVVTEDTDELGWARAGQPDRDAPNARHLARLEWLRDVGPAGAASRSALLLAGFNAWLAGFEQDGFDTGLVTAGEFAMLDLAGTELVVLSACETGAGGEEYADGSQVGLRADALAAGARLCISSLWNVDDRLTASLMERFYEHLVTGVAALDALRLAQLDIRAEHPDPRLWAAWVAEGG